MFLWRGGSASDDNASPDTDTTAVSSTLGADDGVVVTPKSGASGAASDYAILPNETSVGFLGLGTINNAVATGYLTSEAPPPRVVVSPRSPAKAAALRKAFPARVVVAKSNQEVVDACKWVFLAVLPSQAADVLKELTFTPEHVVISLMAGVPAADLEAMLGSAVPARNIVRAIPLPVVKDHAGVTLVCPRHDETVRIFNLLGTAVAVDSEDVMNKMVICTCAMGAYYQFLQTCHAFLVEKQGVDPAAASTYVGALFHSIALDGKQAGEKGFDALIAEQTPGGFNEMGIRELREAGVWEEYTATLTSLAARWAGEAGADEGARRPVTTRGRRFAALEARAAAAEAEAVEAKRSAAAQAERRFRAEAEAAKTRACFLAAAGGVAIGIGIGIALAAGIIPGAGKGSFSSSSSKCCSSSSSSSSSSKSSAALSSSSPSPLALSSSLFSKIASASAIIASS